MLIPTVDTTRGDAYLARARAQLIPSGLGGLDYSYGTSDERLDELVGWQRLRGRDAHHAGGVLFVSSSGRARTQNVRPHRGTSSPARRATTPDRVATTPEARFAAAVNATQTKGPSVEYAIVSAAAVSDEVRSAAMAGMRFAAFYLGVAPAGLHWFRQARYVRGADQSSTFQHHSVDGLAHALTNTIGLHCDVTPVKAVEAGAHEVYHLADASASETAAIEFGREASNLLIRRGRIAAVHAVDRSPAKTRLLANVARSDDVAIAPGPHGPEAYVNVGSRSCPEWRQVA